MPNPNPSPETRFEPGQSGNPNGRPKGRALTATLRDRVEDRPAESGRTFRQALVDRLLFLALQSDEQANSLRAIKEVFNRLDGPAVRPEADANEFLAALESAERADRNYDPDRPPGMAPARDQE